MLGFSLVFNDIDSDSIFGERRFDFTGTTRICLEKVVCYEPTRVARYHHQVPI